MLKTPHMYFSYTYDLTHTLQRLHNTMPEFLQVNYTFLFTYIVMLIDVTVYLNILIIVYLFSRCPCMRGLMKGLFGTAILYVSWLVSQSYRSSFYLWCLAVSTFLPFCELKLETNVLNLFFKLLLFSCSIPSLHCQQKTTTLHSNFAPMLLQSWDTVLHERSGPRGPSSKLCWNWADNRISRG